jgi:hypothetical protein
MSARTASASARHRSSSHGRRDSFRRRLLHKAEPPETGCDRPPTTDGRPVAGARTLAIQLRMCQLNRRSSRGASAGCVSRTMGDCLCDSLGVIRRRTPGRPTPALPSSGVPRSRRVATTAGLITNQAVCGYRCDLTHQSRLTTGSRSWGPRSAAAPPADNPRSMTAARRWRWRLPVRARARRDTSVHGR